MRLSIPAVYNLDHLGQQRLIQMNQMLSHVSVASSGYV